MVDRRYREEFTPFYFDLVINDEAHRSIYGDAREVVQFFQATRVGLTATPKAYLKNINVEELEAENPKALEARQLRDTYHYFGCEPGLPTFRYDIIDAVKDPEGPFLCLPKIFDVRSDITTQALAERGGRSWSMSKTKTSKSRTWSGRFSPLRATGSCAKPSSRKPRETRRGAIGKSIVFAVNQKHATNLTKIFNDLQPDLAVTITSRIPDASSIAKDFRDGKRPERIAVSVDMLSTGYNCRDLLNIGLMRPIFSPTEYIQIKGRGTRLFTFKFGHTEYEKKYFFLLDFCAVAEYFEEKYDYSLPLKLPREKKGKDAARRAQSGGQHRGRRCDEAGSGWAGAVARSRVGRHGPCRSEVIARRPGRREGGRDDLPGSFERDLRDSRRRTLRMKAAVADETTTPSRRSWTSASTIGRKCFTRRTSLSFPTVCRRRRRPSSTARSANAATDEGRHRFRHRQFPGRTL